MLFEIQYLLLNRFTYELGISFIFELMNKKIIFYILICLGLLYSCSSKPKTPDVSNVKIQLNVFRFDQDLAALNKKKIGWDDISQLKNKYPEFTGIYFERIANVTPVNDTSSLPYIQNFIQDIDIAAINDSVQKKFSDFSGYEKKLELAFKFYKYYFPKKFVPSIITYVFGFNYAVVATDSSLCIALDQYMGENFPYYEHMERYIRVRKRPEYLVADAMRGWALTEFETPQPRNTLMDEMIHQGKIQYFLSQVLPQENDSILMGYTSAQLKFCRQNEYMIWSYFIENKMLYSNDFRIITKYCNEAPFSAGMPKDSPGRTGIWIGWQIVKTYMKRNKNVTLEQLMNNFNHKQILELSRYKPKR